jgi:hypothetical protein
MRRLSLFILWAAPFVDIGLAAVRPLRVPGLYQSLGVLWFAIICAAFAVLVPWRSAESRPAGAAAALLLAPFSLVALLWVGLGPPWEATLVENRMRYVVLLTAALAVTGGFTLLWVVLRGERLLSTLGWAAGLLAGVAYLVWSAFAAGVYVAAVRDGKATELAEPLAEGMTVLLFFGCALTYLATAAFAASLRAAGWLGRGGATAFIAIALIALVMLAIRGLAFPDHAESPWYTSPGFIVGIPAVPWIMPHLLGVVVLRRVASAAPGPAEA